MDLLALSCQHLFTLTTTANWRAAIATHIYITHILPIWRLLIHCEEDSSLSSITPTTADSATNDKTATTARILQSQVEYIIVLFYYYLILSSSNVTLFLYA